MIIQILNPCHENWEEMTPTEKGRFCTACQKNVIDFTTFSDAEIVAYLSKNQNTCGRFYQKQLEKDYAALSPLNTHRPAPLTWLRKGFAAAMLLIINAPLTAQSNISDKVTLQGYIIDGKTQATIPFSVVFLYEIKDDGTLIEKGYKKTASKATYSFDLERNKQYKVQVYAGNGVLNDVLVSTQNLPTNDMQEAFLIEKNIAIKAEEIPTLAGGISVYEVTPKRKKWFFWQKNK